MMRTPGRGTLYRAAVMLARFALLVGASSSGILCAQDYLGASAVLRQVEERKAKPAEKP